MTTASYQGTPWGLHGLFVRVDVHHHACRVLMQLSILNADGSLHRQEYKSGPCTVSPPLALRGELVYASYLHCVDPFQT